MYIPKSPLLFVIFEPYDGATELEYPVVTVPFSDHIPPVGLNVCLKLPIILVLVPALVARQNPIASEVASLNNAVIAALLKSPVSDNIAFTDKYFTPSLFDSTLYVAPLKLY